MSDETPTLTLIARLQFLADTMEGDCRRQIDTMPSAEIDSTLKMVADFREAAGQLEDGETLLEMLKMEDPHEDAARALLTRIRASDPMPTGVTMEWLDEVSE